MDTPRVFLAFDVDHDDRERARFTSESRTSVVPFTIQSCSSVLMLPPRRLVRMVADEMSLCDLMIVLVGRTTAHAQRVQLEIRVANALELPRFGVYARSASPSTDLPDGLSDDDMLPWAWPSIASNIERLTQASPAS